MPPGIVSSSKPEQHLERRSARPAASGDDRLRQQLEAILLERRLQPLQPLNLAAMTRHGLVARGIHMHVIAALLGDVARRIGSAHELLGGAAFARDLDEPDAHADVEDLVLPDEPIVVDLAHDIVGDLARLLERTADEQQAELVAAEPSHGIGVADRLFDERRHLAQHVVARDVAAAIVHGLEAIEIEIAEHVTRRARVSDFDGLIEPALELASIDETRQGVVARLIRHLPRQAAQLGHVAHERHRAHQMPRSILERRDRELDRTASLPHPRAR